MMFVRVSKSFLKLLFLYSFFFITFGTGFYILFHSVILGNKTSAFDHRVSSIVKTFVMLSGELDFNDMYEDIISQENYVGILGWNSTFLRKQFLFQIPFLER